jgi:ketosteroid isomerase-like protein
MMRDAISIVRDWHGAVNAGDTELLAGLVSDNVEIGGPRGSAYGRDVLIDWVERTGIRMEPTDWYQRGETVIVCQQASWPTDDGTLGIPQKVGSVFVVRDGCIESVVRYPGLVEAFAATGLAETDRIGH